ncbi:hypothetical protein ACLQ3C_19615 [Gordonia sp. DT30]|uniref:hypothetical protein n=1 Tax=unclassified Gordonia (in: high G+C Gram-positive bacteria) TaxID=2657482 RepID=UPI003CF74709
MTGRWPALRATPPVRHERRARRELRRAADDLDDVRCATGAFPTVPRWWWAMPVLLLVAAVAAAATGVVMWVRAANAYTDTDFEARATDVVELLLSPNPTAPDRVRQVLDDATGAFYDEFAQSADAYTAFVRRSGTTATATVDGTGVTARSTTSATVLVAATVGYQQTDHRIPDRRFRLRVAVTDDSGVLKVAAVQYLP